VGHTFRIDAPAGKQEQMYQIVGLVKNSKYDDLRDEFPPTGYLPIAQREESEPDPTFMIRYRGSPTQFIAGAKQSIAGLSPAIIVDFTKFSKQMSESLLREQLMAALSTAFAVLAALLAALGLYSVIAYMVVRRRNEIGVRMALGAGGGQVVRLVLREAVILLFIGLAAGIAISLFATRAAATLLYGLKPQDPISLVIAIALLTTIALVAAWAPARRAAALDPMNALRDDG
jgi:ABC-type antimicrobial peptide transport system permease subunit